MTQKAMKSELRNQTESQSDGFADVAAEKARAENGPAPAEDALDDKAIRERAHQLYQESHRQGGNADERLHQAEREPKSRRT